MSRDQACRYAVEETGSGGCLKTIHGVHGSGRSCSFAEPFRHTGPEAVFDGERLRGVYGDAVKAAGCLRPPGIE